VFTDVFALGAVVWLAVVLVSLLARLRPLPLPPPACVLAVVFVDWFADVVWLVVPLGAIVTVLCGIALNWASVLTVVFAVGAVVWFAVVLVLLPAVLLCAIAAALHAAQTAAAITFREFFRITVFSSCRVVSERKGAAFMPVASIVVSRRQPGHEKHGYCFGKPADRAISP
jgi:hypothetical protein